MCSILALVMAICPPHTCVYAMSSNQDDETIPKPTYQRPAGMTSLFGQVEEVKTVMIQNMEEMHQRGEKLAQLEDTSRQMMEGAQEFQKGGSNAATGKKKK